MFENDTNLSSDEEFDEDFDLGTDDFDSDENFEDYADQHDEENDESGQKQSPAAQTQADEIEVVYNGQPVKVKADEAKTLIQKGLNYDKALQRAMQNPAQTAVSQLAKMSGQKEEEIISSLLNAAQQNAVKELTDKGMPPELAQEYLKLKLANEQAQSNVSMAQQQDSELEAWGELVREFPKEDFSNLPDEVVSAVQSGVRPLVAYYRYLGKQQAQQKAQQTQKQQVKQKSPGSVSGRDNDEKDPFKSGFWGN